MDDGDDDDDTDDDSTDDDTDDHDDDDTDDDNDHKNDGYTAAGAAPGASLINIEYKKCIDHKTTFFLTKYYIFLARIDQQVKSYHSRSSKQYSNIKSISIIKLHFSCK